MTGALIFRLVLLGLVFLAWAALMYRMLFTIRRRAEAETGNLFPGSGGFLRHLGHWLRSPEDKTDRQTLFFLTFVLFAMIAMQILLP